MNKVILMGRLTKDPDIKYTKTNNTMVASFGLAVNRRFTKQGEEKQVDFINIIAWNKLAEFVSNYLHKGQQINIIGRLQTRNWENEQGQKYYITEVIAEEIYFADSNKKTENNNLKTDELPFTDITETQEDDLPF